MGQTIHPERQTVQQCLKGKEYFVDFYQREYVWNKKTVYILLDDIFEVFEQSYAEFKDAELTEEVLASFSWYYLNVFITSKENNKTYIVDGQQRLTTLSLICAKLYHLTKDSDEKELLKSCIYGSGWKKKIFFIDNDKRERAMKAIVEETPRPEPFESATEGNLLNRYDDISDYIDKKALDNRQLTSFIYYVLNKLVLVELEIENQNDTAMVFEVINDRGEALKPFEILKGKLISMLPKTDSEKYSDMWDKSMLMVKDSEDKFFSTYIKSKFIFNRNSEKEIQINNAYHRYIYEDNDEAKAIGVRKCDPNRIKSIKKFIEEDVEYYSRLYAKITNSSEPIMKYCNSVLKLDGQYQLIMAACDINDNQETVKIQAIAREFERLYMLLRFNGVYDSNEFRDITYHLAGKLIGADIAYYRGIFDDSIKAEIKEKHNITGDVELLEYADFQKLSYETTSAFYYTLARVEDYLCKKMDITPHHDVEYMSTKHSNVYGYHIEHIMSENDTNRAYFADEQEFKEKRNNIGGLLLLKGLDNISSGNEEYSDKLKTYSHGPVWGHTLCDDFYNSNVKFNNFNATLKKEKGVEIKPYSTFTPGSMEERCKLLFELVKIIWDVNQENISATLKASV